jgi:hypothetical protein
VLLNYANKAVRTYPWSLYINMTLETELPLSATSNYTVAS